jgi:hypothetical protein
MPNASTTQTSSASLTTGQPIPLAYGFVWATGKRQEYYELQNTGSSWMDYTRLGIWLLGDGEWDGPVELWINDKLVLRGLGVPTTPPPGFSGQNWVKGLDNNPQFPALVFNFHSGCDAVIGSGLTPSSSGPDQGVDVLFAQLPPAIQPATFNRIANYAIMRKQAIQNQTSDHRTDPSQWGDIAPIVLWRALKCRIFDDEGNQTGYAFTTNPAWHIVDVYLRRKVMPDYGLDLSAGPDAISSAVQNRFDWGSIYQTAQICDRILANGRRQFTGNYTFAQQTSLQAIAEQMLLCCRSFKTEYDGKIGLRCDAARPSVFTFSRAHILPGSWEAGDRNVHKSANRYIANFRDLLVPQCSEIASITLTNGARPVVTTVDPHPFLAGDYIAIGGTGTVYDGQWSVYSVPAVLNPGTITEVDPSTFVLVSKGENYPASVGAVGGCGLLYSRFKERAPEFWHKTNMLARGAIGPGIARRREKVKQSLDFATTTWDQASRLTCYERDRQLGIDQTPYITPPAVKFRTSMFARDVNGNLAAAVRPGDHVTLDDTTNFQYAGEYEVLEPMLLIPPSVQASGTGGELALKPAENSGELEFPLGPYNEAIMYDTSDPTQAGWPSVEGSDPGNESNFTGIALADGNNFVFFTGQLPTGDQFDLPSTGYPTANMLAWAGPAGANIRYHSMHTIQLCSASASRQLTLIYSDCEGTTWGGDLNFAAVSWLGSETVVTSNGMKWLELTLLGGEKIVFGQGYLADGATIVLPAGYTAAQAFATAYPYIGENSGNNPRIVGADVDANLGVHFTFSDFNGNLWHGTAQVLVFAWQNNMGTVTTQALGGGNWMQCTLTNGTVFGVGLAKNMADGSTLTLPVGAGDGSTLQAMVGSSSWANVANAGHTIGVWNCYLDAENIVHIQFGSIGQLIGGMADVFALYCSAAASTAALVSVSPVTVSMPAGSTQQFAAKVTNSANTAVTWAVAGGAGLGVIGGNAAFGTISTSGLYSAPATPGTYTVETISYDSSGNPLGSGTATVTVTDGSDGSNGSGGFTVVQD